MLGAAGLLATGQRCRAAQVARAAAVAGGLGGTWRRWLGGGAQGTWLGGGARRRCLGGGAGDWRRRLWLREEREDLGEE